MVPIHPSTPVTFGTQQPPSITIVESSTKPGQPEPAKQPEKKKGFWSKISQKHIDFVLVDASDTAIRLAIELDDRSHDRQDRRARDAFVDGALDVAGIPILRVPAAGEYDARTLRTAIGEMTRRAA